MRNTQPRERRSRRTDGAVEVIRIWNTIQGEGPFVGCPAIFVRLAGCNLQCPACDTDYTTGRAFMAVSKIAEEVKARSTEDHPLVVITGGEPFRQDLSQVVNRLSLDGAVIQIETNGTIFDATFPYDKVTLVCSPKAGVSPMLDPHIAAYKYIIEDGFVDPHDGLPTSVLGSGLPVGRPRPSFCRRAIYIQPLDTGDETENQRHLKAAIDVCMKWGYRLCLQTHKIIGLD